MVSRQIAFSIVNSEGLVFSQCLAIIHVMAKRVALTTGKGKSWLSKPLSSDILEYRVPIETNIYKNVRGKDVWEPFQVERMCHISEGRTSHCLI